MVRQRDVNRVDFGVLQQFVRVAGNLLHAGHATKPFARRRIGVAHGDELRGRNVFVRESEPAPKRRSEFAAHQTAADDAPF
jgi:hypothetical protein